MSECKKTCGNCEYSKHSSGKALCRLTGTEVIEQDGGCYEWEPDFEKIQQEGRLELQQQLADRDATIKKQARALEDIHDLVRFLESGNDRIMMQAELKSQERQLDAAARDMCRHVSASCNVCPVYNGDMGGCLERPWRKRWEDEANGR